MAVPPGAGEREGAAGLENGSLVRTGEESEGVLVATTFFGGDVNGEGRTLSVEGKTGEGGVLIKRRGVEAGGDGVEGEGIGAMAVECFGDADPVSANDAGEAAEGVGELVGIAETTLEKLVLGVLGEGGGEFEVELVHGRGRAEGVEIGMQMAHEGVGVERGFGEDEGACVRGSIFESQGEKEFGGGALMVVEAVAKGLEKAFGHEKEGFEVVDRWLEVVLYAVMWFGAIGLEEAVVFSVGDVVESGEFGAKTFDEPLAGYSGEIFEGAEPPKMKNLRMG